MEQICRNCEYFVQGSTHSDAYTWGDCMNPETAVVDANGKTRGVFRWADGSCMYFKPKSGL